MLLRVEAAGGWVVAVLVFEVVEPFFSCAAAPQHIPSWIRLPLTAVGQAPKATDTRFLLRPSRTRRPSQSNLRSAGPGSHATGTVESMGQFRLVGAARASSCEEGPMQPASLTLRFSSSAGQDSLGRGLRGSENALLSAGRSLHTAPSSILFATSAVHPTLTVLVAKRMRRVTTGVRRSNTPEASGFARRRTTGNCFRLRCGLRGYSAAQAAATEAAGRREGAARFGRARAGARDGSKTSSVCRIFCTWAGPPF